MYEVWRCMRCVFERLEDAEMLYWGDVRYDRDQATDAGDLVYYWWGRVTWPMTNQAGDWKYSADRPRAPATPERVDIRPIHCRIGGKYRNYHRLQSGPIHRGSCRSLSVLTPLSSAFISIFSSSVLSECKDFYSKAINFSVRFVLCCPGSEYV